MTFKHIHKVPQFKLIHIEGGLKIWSFTQFNIYVDESLTYLK